MTTQLKPKIAISSDFLTALFNIPYAQQNKVRKFIEDFKNNPTSSAINYEKILNARDSKLRSVRIDETYRGIILKPEKGDVYLLLWVDHHDKAYQWAMRKTCKINPETGSLQIFEVDLQINEETSQDSVKEDNKVCIFEDLRDRDLIRFGLPEQSIPLIRKICTEDELDKIQDKIPQEVYDALLLIASGYTLEETYRELDKVKESMNVDIEDYASALENIDSRRRFYLVEDDMEFQAILNAPMEKWRVFLHPSQRKIVERDWNGAVRVLGGAGTGKTVVAMHRAKWLAENRFTNNNDRILFTTFTRNLAGDIYENLEKICTPDVLQKIEVINLDKWVSDYLHKNGYNYEIVYYDDITNELWKNALTYSENNEFPESFYKEEWEKIIQTQDINTFQKYAKASRVGRGIQLSFKQRKEVWPVFEEYRVQLNERNIREPEDAIRDAYSLLRQKEEVLSYKAIIVDEAQDMGMNSFKLLRQMLPENKNDIFIVGDGHQRIYRHKVILGQCNINILGRSKKLRINYRTTEEIKNWAVNILAGQVIDDLNGETDDNKGYKSLMHGADPLIKSFDSFEKEINFLKACLEQINNEENTLANTCVVLRTNDLLEQYKRALSEKGFKVKQIKRSAADVKHHEELNMATMHRIKGLEFNNIIISGMNDGIVPLRLNNFSEDPVVVKEQELVERSLLYVAATRAKKKVIITSFGKISKFIEI